MAPLASRVLGHPQVLGTLLLGLVATPAVVQLLVRRKGLVLDAPALAMFGLLGASLVSTFAARDAPTALAWIATYALEGIVLYLFVVNAVRSVRTLRRAMWTLVATSALLGSLGIYQELTHNYQQQFAGLAQRDLELERRRQVSAAAPIRSRERVALAQRAAGPIGDPNRYAQMLLVALPLGFYLMRRSGSIWQAAGAAGCTASILCGIFLTYSRGGWLALGVVVTASLASGLLRWRVFVPALVLGSLLVFAVAPGTAARLRSIGSVQALLSDRVTASADGAVRGRMTEMLAALHVFMDHPVLGVGPGHFSPFYSVDYMDEPEIAFRRRTEPRRAHNLYLEIAAETGILGLVAFLAVVMLLARGLVAARRRLAAVPEVRDLATAFGLALVAYLATGCFLHLSFQRLFWLLAALAGSAAQVLAPNQVEPEPAPAVGGTTSTTVLQSARAPA